MTPHDGTHLMEDISRVVDWLAVAVILIALLATVAGVVLMLSRGASARAIYLRGREILGRGILIGLEVLVAADLIRTVAVQPTVRNVSVLGLIVLVRVVLSFAIDVEIDGVLPWRKREVDARDRAG